MNARQYRNATDFQTTYHHRRGQIIARRSGQTAILACDNRRLLEIKADKTSRVERPRVLAFFFAFVVRADFAVAALPDGPRTPFIATVGAAHLQIEAVLRSRTFRSQSQCTN